MAKFKINFAEDGGQYHGPVRSYVNDAIRGTKLAFWHVASRRGIAFRAMLKNFSENFNPGWSSEKTIGRMDEIANYSNTTRRMNVSFDVPAESENEAVYNMGLLSGLIKMLYPTYDSPDNFATTLSAPPLMRVKFANLICRPTKNLTESAEFAGLLCYISNLKWTPRNEMGYMNIYPGEMHPRLFEIGFDITIIHEHQLGWEPSTTKELNEEFTFFPHNISIEDKLGRDPHVFGSDLGVIQEYTISDSTNQITQQTLQQSYSSEEKNYSSEE